MSWCNLPASGLKNRQKALLHNLLQEREVFSVTFTLRLSSGEVYETERFHLSFGREKKSYVLIPQAEKSTEKHFGQCARDLKYANLPM